MSERPTPETDAIVRNAATADHPPTRLAATLTVKCGKLERERDEAIADRDIARISAMDSDKAHDRMVGELEKVYKERDKLKQVIIATLEENRHLADGDDCTLAKLKSVVPEWK